MKKIYLLAFVILSHQAFSQAIRLHIGGGFSSYLGDLQQKKLSFDQAKAVYSAGASVGITDNIAVRIDFSKAQVSGDDKKGSAKLQRRNLNFQSSITDITLLGEYTWVNDYTGLFMPYFFAGIGVYKFDPYTYDRSGRKAYLHDLSTEGQGLEKYPGNKMYSLTQLNIPFGGGLKYNLSPSIFIAGEVGIRKLFTDYLDDVSGSYADQGELLKARGQLAVDLAFRGNEIPPYNANYPKAGSQRGNKDKDWYYFGQLRISFRLGGNGSGKGFLRRLGCPGKF